MAQKLLSIDIREDFACAVMLSMTAGTVNVVKSALAVVEQRALSEVVAEVLNHVGFQGEPCRITLGAEQFSFRNLTFPFADKRKINRILPFELEESTPVDMEDLLVDSLAAGMANGETAVIAAMINRESLRQQLSDLKELGLDPEIVAISNVQTALQFSRMKSQSDFILLDAGCNKLTLFIVVDSKIDLIRTIAFDDGTRANFAFDKNSQVVSARRPEKTEETLGEMCRLIHHTLVTLAHVDNKTPVFLTGPLAGVTKVSSSLSSALRMKVWSCDLTGGSVKVGMGCGNWRSDVMTSALALGLRSGKKQNGFNFRRDEFLKKASMQQFKKLIPRLGIPVAVCLVVLIGYLWNDFIMGERELKLLKMKGREVFSETLPDIKRIVDPVQQLKVQINDLKKGTLGDDNMQADIMVLDILAEISVRIPQSQNVHVIRMVADRNGILLRGLTDNFNTVDNLKKVLEKSPYFSSVIINSANLAPKEAGIRFELKLLLNRV